MSSNFGFLIPCAAAGQPGKRESNDALVAAGTDFS